MTTLGDVLLWRQRQSVTLLSLRRIKRTIVIKIVALRKQIKFVGEMNLDSAMVCAMIEFEKRGAS